MSDKKSDDSGCGCLVLILAMIVPLLCCCFWFNSTETVVKGKVIERSQYETSLGFLVYRTTYVTVKCDDGDTYEVQTGNDKLWKEATDVDVVLTRCKTFEIRTVRQK